MNDLATYTQQLPDTLKDLSKFVLVGREKLNSVRAEIRAIDKLHLAEEVRNQKREEARMLSEAILDAEARLGDLLKQIPKEKNQYSSARDSTVPSKPKKEVIKDLGLSKKQAERFETLADNKDFVEQVKQEARENDDLPTRTRVIDLAQQRKKKDEDYYSYITECGKLSKKYLKALYAFLYIKADETEFKMLNDTTLGAYDESLLREVDDTIAKLGRLRNYLKGVKK